MSETEARRRGAPLKAGLDYIPQRVDPMADMQTYDLVDEYGPLGYMIYDLIVKDVLSEGYYLEISVEKFVRKLQSQIGSRWVKNRKVVTQVIYYLADIGLLHDGLLADGIITSVPIQRIYLETAVKRMRRRLYSDKYWLLGQDEEPDGSGCPDKEGAGALLNLPENRINAEENRINSAIIRLNAEENRTERKVKESKANNYISIASGPPGILEDDEADRALGDYIAMRRTKKPLTDVQVQTLVSILQGITTDPAEQAQVIRAATAGGWSSFFPLPKKPKAAERTAKAGSGRKTSSFYNFEQRNYDYDKLEAAMLNMPIETGEAAAEGDECKTG